MDAQTLHIDFIVPQGWHELTDAQLRYVYNLIALEMSMDEIAVTCLLQWSGTVVIGRQPDGAYFLPQKKQLFEVKPLAIAELAGEIREAAAAAEEQPKRRKVVEFHILASIMEFASEKAQLLAFHTEAGEEVKFWLSKSLTHFVADGDAPEKMICRIPAWLYYKSGLDKFFPVERWSQTAI